MERHYREQYNIGDPNIFCANDRFAFPFGKGLCGQHKLSRWDTDGVWVMEKVRFWEDHWFGSCSLTIQYWDIYYKVNEQGCTLAEA
jgi:hypothetical protein